MRTSLRQTPMATIYIDEQPIVRREWALHLGRRGLKLDGELRLHGPHSPANYVWGEAECTSVYGLTIDADFTTDGGRLRVWGKGHDRERFPVMRGSEMPPGFRRWLNEMRQDLHRLRREERLAA